VRAMFYLNVRGIIDICHRELSPKRVEKVLLNISHLVHGEINAAAPRL
jgi:hypothetical protein